VRQLKKPTPIGGKGEVSPRVKKRTFARLKRQPTKQKTEGKGRLIASFSAKQPTTPLGIYLKNSPERLKIPYKKSWRIEGKMASYQR